MELEIPPIEASIPCLTKDATYPSVVQRYYTKYLYKEDKNNLNQTILLHSNRICLVTLHESHPVIAEKKGIQKLNFQVTNKINRLDNAVRGKGKKGGQNVDEKAILVIIECSDGSSYPVRSCLKGKLIEINENVVKSPELILQDPQGEGFIAIILPKLPDGLQDMKTRLERLDNEESDPLLLDDEA